MRNSPSSLRIKFTLVRLALYFLVGMSQLTWIIHEVSSQNSKDALKG
jgi:hypothetical protein